VNPGDWTAEVEGVRDFFQKFGNRLPKQLNDELKETSRRLEQVAAASP
jgi:GTP-dependent phosphoenolpyruvate carboxykinase